MTSNPGTVRPILRAGLISSLALALAACVSDGGGALDSVASEIQPRYATYSCGEEGRITVENRRTAVRLVEDGGASYDLPAAPPTQTSRYGMEGLALVLDGREALWMKARHQPITCRR